MFATVLTTITTIWRPGFIPNRIKVANPGMEVLASSVFTNQKNQTDMPLYGAPMRTKLGSNTACSNFLCFLSVFQFLLSNF